MPKIQSIHRYPVKSMFGEELAETKIEKGGLAGDRRWAIYNIEEGEIQGGRNLPLLLTLRAEYVREPIATDSGTVRVVFPDGRSIETDTAIESPELNHYLGKRVRLCLAEPAHNLVHYRRRIAATATHLDEQMGVAEGEQKADFSALPAGAMATGLFFATPPGFYYDLFPLHLLTSGALKYMERKSGNPNFCAGRFRPNFVLTNQIDDAVEEFRWVGFIAELGAARIKIEAETVRCSIPGRGQPGIAADKTIVRDVAKFSERHLGVYASVIQPGKIKIGDSLHIDFQSQSPWEKEVHMLARNVKKSLLDFIGG